MPRILWKPIASSRGYKHKWGHPLAVHKVTRNQTCIGTYFRTENAELITLASSLYVHVCVHLILLS